MAVLNRQPTPRIGICYWSLDRSLRASIDRRRFPTAEPLATTLRTLANNRLI